MAELDASSIFGVAYVDAFRLATLTSKSYILSGIKPLKATDYEAVGRRYLSEGEA